MMKLPGWIRRILSKIKIVAVEAAVTEAVGGLDKIAPETLTNGEDMRFCSACGKLNRADAVFCGACGRRLGQ